MASWQKKAAKLASGRLAGLARQAGSFRAYHGSPHDFDRFDASKIGTGEGAQAYGHGLYFAGNENVAREYRDNLKGLVDRPVPDQLADELQAVIKDISSLAERRASARGDEWSAIQRALDNAHARHHDVQHRVRVASQNPGRMYEVQIDYPEELLLDLDLPLDEHHGDVQSALRELDAFPEFPSSVPWKPTGEHAYKRIKELHMANTPLSSAKSAALLRDAGIPGMRYLDAHSRATGDGTHNYVIFPGAEDRISILRKYGLLAPVAGGAAAAGSGEQKQPRLLDGLRN